MLFLCIFFWGGPESCKVHSCAYNECKLAQSRGRKICEKSPTGCFQEVTEWWALQEPELKSSAPQTDHGTAISHCLLTHSVFAGRYPRLHWFICKTINSPNFSLVSTLRKSFLRKWLFLRWFLIASISEIRAACFLPKRAQRAFSASSDRYWRSQWTLCSKKKWHLLVPMRSLIRLYQAFPGP